MWILSKYRIDLTGDDIKEVIEIKGYAPTKEKAQTAIWEKNGFDEICIYKGISEIETGDSIYTAEISREHEGFGDFAICDYYGRNCLVRFENTPRNGRNEFWYEVIGFLEDGTTEMLKQDYAFYSAPISIEDPIQIQTERQMRLNPKEVVENLVRVHDGLNEILQGKSTVVLSFSSISSFSFYYEPETLHTLTAYEVFTSALEDGFPRGKSVMYALLNGWEETMDKLVTDEYLEQIRKEWKTIEPEFIKLFYEYKNLEDLYWGNIKMEQETTILPESSKDSLYWRITDSRFQSAADIETLIQNTCSGNELKIWYRLLLYYDTYMDYDGNLYRAEASATGVSPFPNNKILSFGKVSEDCWIVTMDAGTDKNDFPRGIELGIVKDNGKWKIAHNLDMDTMWTQYTDEMGMNPLTTWRGNDKIKFSVGSLQEEQILKRPVKKR